MCALREGVSIFCFVFEKFHFENDMISEFSGFPDFDITAFPLYFGSNPRCTAVYRVFTLEIQYTSNSQLCVIAELQSFENCRTFAAITFSFF